MEYTESEQVTPVDSIKDIVRSSVKVPELDKHLKKAGGYISRNVMEITIKMKTIVRKPLMINFSAKRTFQSFMICIYILEFVESKFNIHSNFTQFVSTKNKMGSLCGTVANMVDCNIIVSEFKLQSHH